MRALVDDPKRLSSVVEFDRTYVGDVTGRTLLHSQCHIGTDTVSWGKLGASITGIDFSAPALEVARSMAAELALDARFVETDVYSAPDVLDGEFDIVYTGVGAINWLPDIARWARVMAHFTRPGGTFLMREGHPILWALDYDEPNQRLVLDLPYFETEAPGTWVETETYMGTGQVAHATHHDWNHGVGEILTALIGAGFTIDLFEEHRFLEWSAVPWMVERDGRWYLPDHQRDLAPLMYTIRATRTGAD